MNKRPESFPEEDEGSTSKVADCNEWEETSREKENWIIKMSRKGVIILMSLYDVS